MGRRGGAGAEAAGWSHPQERRRPEAVVRRQHGGARQRLPQRHPARAPKCGQVRCRPQRRGWGPDEGEPGRASQPSAAVAQPRHVEPRQSEGVLARRGGERCRGVTAQVRALRDAARRARCHVEAGGSGGVAVQGRIFQAVAGLAVAEVGGGGGVGAGGRRGAEPASGRARGGLPRRRPRGLLVIRDRLLSTAPAPVCGATPWRPTAAGVCTNEHTDCTLVFR